MSVNIIKKILALILPKQAKSYASSFVSRSHVNSYASQLDVLLTDNSQVQQYSESPTVRAIIRHLLESAGFKNVRSLDQISQERATPEQSQINLRTTMAPALENMTNKDINTVFLSKYSQAASAVVSRFREGQRMETNDVLTLTQAMKKKYALRIFAVDMKSMDSKDVRRMVNDKAFQDHCSTVLKRGGLKKKMTIQLRERYMVSLGIQEASAGYQNVVVYFILRYGEGWLRQRSSFMRGFVDDEIVIQENTENVSSDDEEALNTTLSPEQKRPERKEEKEGKVRAATPTLEFPPAPQNRDSDEGEVVFDDTAPPFAYNHPNADLELGNISSDVMDEIEDDKILLNETPEGRTLLQRAYDMLPSGRNIIAPLVAMAVLSGGVSSKLGSQTRPSALQNAIIAGGIALQKLVSGGGDKEEPMKHDIENPKDTELQIPDEEDSQPAGRTPDAVRRRRVRDRVRRDRGENFGGDELGDGTRFPTREERLRQAVANANQAEDAEAIEENPAPVNVPNAASVAAGAVGVEALRNKLEEGSVTIDELNGVQKEETGGPPGGPPLPPAEKQLTRPVQIPVISAAPQKPHTTATEPTLRPQYSMPSKADFKEDLFDPLQDKLNSEYLETFDQYTEFEVRDTGNWMQNLAIKQDKVESVIHYEPDYFSEYKGPVRREDVKGTPVEEKYTIYCPPASGKMMFKQTPNDPFSATRDIHQNDALFDDDFISLPVDGYFGDIEARASSYGQDIFGIQCDTSQPVF